MAHRMFGLELEMALTAFGLAGKRVDPSRVLHLLMELAHQRLRCLPAVGDSGLFLENGARFYIDCCKPEVTTPEVVTPTDACRYARAGEAILLELANQLRDQDASIHQVVLSRCNMGYGQRASTWGCHESYCHRQSPGLPCEQLIPHLVSRIIYTGGGGFDNRSAGIVYLLSPRVAVLRKVSSGESQRNRGIIHTKREPLSDGFGRLHILCGEHVCSDLSLWLKMGTTALVVAMIEAGHQPGEAVMLRDPLRAMKRFARDLELTSRAHTRDGRRLGAVQIQRHYLEQAEQRLGEPFMPDWAPDLCRAWRAILDRLEQGVVAVSTTLDWAIKLQLVRRLVQSRGMTMEALEHWSVVLEQLAEAKQARDGSASDGRTVGLDVLGPASPVAAEVRRLTPWLAERGLAWDQLETVLQLRQQLFELDTRFGQVGPEGIFTAINEAGVLDHHVPGVDDGSIRQAMTEPPSVGRAQLRGRLVKQLAGSDDGGLCSWTAVWNRRRGRMVDMSDPFNEEERWSERSPDETELLGFPCFSVRYFRAPEVIVQRELDAARRLYNAGNYERAAAKLDAACQAAMAGGIARTPILNRYLAWNQARRGFLDGAAWLDRLRRDEDLGVVCDYVCVHRFEGLVPSPAIERWLERAHQLGLEAPSDRPAAVAALLGHEGYKLLCEGRPAEALELLEQAARPDRLAHASPRLKARLLSELSEAHRQLDRRSTASQLLDEAQQLQQRHRCEGDLADFTLTRRAKLLADTDPQQSKELLRKARQIQQRLGNVMGLVRTLLLLARLPRNPRFTVYFHWLSVTRRKVVQLREQRPALRQCPLLARILEHWTQWTRGEMLEDHDDAFWGL